MIFLPALAWIATAYGWRYAAVTVAGVAMLIVFPIVAIVVRDRPQSIGLEPYGATEPVPVPERLDAPVPPRDRRPAARLPLADVLVPDEHVLHLRPLDQRPDRDAPDPGRGRPPHDRGHRRVAARADGALRRDRHDGLGLAHRPPRSAAPARLVLRVPRPRRDRACRSRSAPGYALVAFAVFYGLDWVATVPPTVAITADTFGRERVGIVFGWVFAAHQFGAAFAAWAGGASRTWLGTYNYAFVSRRRALPARRRALAADQHPRPRPGPPRRSRAQARARDGLTERRARGVEAAHAVNAAARRRRRRAEEDAGQRRRVGPPARDRPARSVCRRSAAPPLMSPPT